MLCLRLGAFGFIISLITLAFAQPATQKFTVSGVVKDSNGAAIENANIQLTAGRVKIQFTVTDDSGSFRFNRIPSGAYQLSAEHPGLESVEICLEITDRSPSPVQVVLVSLSSRLSSNDTANEKRPINACGQSLEGGTSSRDAETLSRFTFNLPGTVKQSNGVTINEATVELRSSGIKIQSAVSDESGNYRFDEVHPGDYKVHAEHSGFEPIDIPVTVGYSEPGRMWITLHESITVTGCLATTGQRDLFVITDESGKVYLVKSLSLSLKDYVGHKIVVTGAISDIDDDDEWTGEYRKNGIKMLTTTAVKAVSSTCQ